MNNQEYEQKRRECWKEYVKLGGNDNGNSSPFNMVFRRAYSLGKQETNQEIKQETDADTVIQGWVARDQDGYISLFKDKPTRDTFDKGDVPYGFWDEANSNHLELPITSFPDLTWESDPQPVEIIIKRKKK